MSRDEISNLRHVSAAFQVHASITASGEIDITGLTLDEIASRAETLHEGIILCHQCNRDVSDPEIGEMTSLWVDGTNYVKVNGHWQKWQETER